VKHASYYLSLALGLAAPACVVSTHGGPGTPPVVPLRQEDEEASAESAARANEPESIVARHILVAYQGGMRAGSHITRSKAEARERAEEAKQRALAGEDFAALANEYSDDPGSAADGGNLGRFTRGQMVPAFSDAAFRLQPGGVSDVVESDFGFHVIQRSE
jgi:parvulin-like peptidyl-prolyl isomerase